MPENVLYNPEGSRILSREMNQSSYRFDPSVTREPKNIITIFTVNTRPQFSTSAGVKFAGRPADVRYLKVGSINDPKYRVDNEAIEGNRDRHKVTEDDGRWEAMDWLNPQNVYSLDQDYQVPDAYEDGTNLLSRGLFFIVRAFDPIHGNANDQPTETELSAAEGRLRARYTALVRRYTQTSTASPGQLPNIMNEEMIDALNYAGMKTPYNATLEQKIMCPRCGDQVLAGVKFHKSESLGVICIEPTAEGWKAAVAAGVKSKADVPDEFASPTKR